MAIHRELWEEVIVSNLFVGNPHLERCKREDDNVVQGRIVHIPQAGAKPNVVKNRSAFPATAVRRADGDIVYVLDTFTSDPIHITNAEKFEESPEKVFSILEDLIMGLRETIGNETIYDWLVDSPAGGVGNPSLAVAPPAIVQTTGANVSSHLPGTTGNRKLFLKEDLKKARLLMNKQNIPHDERFALISSDMMDQLLEDSDMLKRDVASELDLRNGVITRLYGFELIERSTTAVFDASNKLKKLDATPANKDNDVVICYHKNAVALALGDTTFFEKNDDPNFYGDVYSALQRAGSRKRRANSDGVIAIVQG